MSGSNRDRRGSGAVTPARRRPHASAADGPDDELETGEPIEGEEAPAPRKIKAGRGWPAHYPPVEAELDEAAPHGRMVLSTAKYLPAPRVKTPRERPRPATGGKWPGMLAMTCAGIWLLAGLSAGVLPLGACGLFVVGLGMFVRSGKSDG